MTEDSRNPFIIETRNLTKSFGNHIALRGIDLNVGEGECVSILGPNGAGKTTLIKVLATLSRASSGEVKVHGLDTSKDSVRVRRKIGVVSHHPYLYENLTAYENLKFYGGMYDVPDQEGRIRSVIKQVGLEDRAQEPVRFFSRGMQQRLSISRAILHDPPILLLDEPETGLDPHASKLLGQMIRDLIGETRTVLLTTHHLEWALELGHRILVLYKGRIVYEASGQNLGLDQLRDEYYQYTGVTP